MTPVLRPRALALALFLALTSAFGACADDLREIRIGYMKLGLPLIAKARHALEDRFSARGISIKWIEFSVGPPLVEALAAGKLDLGAVGDTPPIFAQSAGANLVYVASGGARTTGSGILVPKNSGLRAVADLRGKRIAICKGSAAENLVIAALERAGLSYGDVVPVYLSPSDAATAFISGQIDAWPTWDPFFALAEKTLGARVLLDAESVAPTYVFFVANGTTAKTHPEMVSEVNGVFAEVADWANAHPDEVVALVTGATGIPVEVERAVIARSHFVIQPVSEDAIAAQQAIAERFAKLKLIPKPVRVRDAVWVAPVPSHPALADTAAQGDASHENR